MIYCIGVESLDYYWPQAAKHLRRIEGLDPAHELALCKHEDRQLWLAVEAGECLGAVTTEVSTEPETVITVMNAAGREMHKWRGPLERSLDEWAEHIGATRLRVIGRKGWVRVLPHFKETARIMEKTYG